jgi:metallo-beta-lactamase family protein
VLARIEQINSMSAHADANEIMQWLSGFPKPPNITYLVHGEPPSLEALQKRITTEQGWTVHIPSHLEKVELAF